MAIRHVLQSVLARQALLLKDQWATRYPHDWLVWESGAPSGSAVSVATTQLPDLNAPRPPKGDGLCFELDAVLERVRVGRALENDIVVPDATVSREHVLLEKRDGVWLVTALPSSRATAFKVQAEVEAADRPLPLASGDQLTLGRVRMTYLSSAAMRALVGA